MFLLSQRFFYRCLMKQHYCSTDWHCAKQITNSHIDFSQFSAGLLILSTNHSFWSWVFISPLPFSLSYEYLSHDSQPLYPTISTISSTLLAELSGFLSLPPSFRSQWETFFISVLTLPRICSPSSTTSQVLRPLIYSGSHVSP